MENQVYHIQTLLANELNSCKGKGNMYINGYIKKIWNTYKQEDQEMKKPVVNDKGK